MAFWICWCFDALVHAFVFLIGSFALPLPGNLQHASVVPQVKIHLDIRFLEGIHWKWYRNSFQKGLEIHSEIFLEFFQKIFHAPH